MLFPKDISPKVNVIKRLKFELAFYDVAVQNVSLILIYRYDQSEQAC